MYNAQDNHHVVHIGGAEFVHPSMSHLHLAPSWRSSISPSSEASSSHSASSSPTHSRFSSSSSNASSAADSLEEWDSVQAHLAYARRMADHTAVMWQKERLAIEKAKLDGTYTGNMTSRQNGNARPQPDSSNKARAGASASASEKKGSKKFGGILASLFTPAESDASRGRSRRRSQ